MHNNAPSMDHIEPATPITFVGQNEPKENQDNARNGDHQTPAVSAPEAVSSAPMASEPMAPTPALVEPVKVTPVPEAPVVAKSSFFQREKKVVGSYMG